MDSFAFLLWPTFSGARFLNFLCALEEEATAVGSGELVSGRALCVVQ